MMNKTYKEFVNDLAPLWALEYNLINIMYLQHTLELKDIGFDDTKPGSTTYVYQGETISIEGMSINDMISERFLSLNRSKRIVNKLQDIYDSFVEYASSVVPPMFRSLFINTMTRIGNEIFYNNYENWKRIYETMVIQYNPIHNYDMTEHEETNSLITQDRNVANDIYGFDSTTDPAPSTEGTQGDTITGDAEDNYTDHTKSGNIGVTTTQKMMQEELEIRKNNFFDIVLKDISNFLLQKIY